jgi:DEAD/DEAH box helicase domain-containing protein
MQTSGLWLTLRPEVLAGISPDRDALIDGLRGLTYLLHHLAPLFLMCDVRDLGSWLGDAAPPDPNREAPRGARVLTTERTRARLLAAERFEPTVYLYDSQPGGVGLAERLFELIGPLLIHARETIRACSCRSGCPSCVGPVNEVGRRAKPMAATLLGHLIG